MVLFESHDDTPLDTHEHPRLPPPWIAQVEPLSPHRARFTLSPLARGLGQSMGCALRRTLLSLLPGCAPTQVTLARARHMQATIDGVREDVTDLLLNLRGVVFRLHGRQDADLSLHVAQPGPVRAGEIVLPAWAEVINPAHVIAHLCPGGVLDLRIRLETGRGFRAGRDARPAGAWAADAAALCLDASFSPVRRVAMAVQPQRVQDRVDLDRLQLDIETNGSITPEQALRQAARLLADQLGPFAADPAPLTVEPAHESAPAWLQGPAAAELARAIDDIDLSVRTCNGLRAANIRCVGDLVRRTERELLQSPQLGRKGVNEIKDALAALGLRLGTAWPDGTPGCRLH